MRGTRAGASQVARGVAGIRAFGAGSGAGSGRTPAHRSNGSRPVSRSTIARGPKRLTA
jgi:hypothetical protein